MSDNLFIVNILSLAFLSFFLFKKMFLGSSLKLTRLTLPSFFIVAYIILMSLPSIKWFYNSTHPIRYTYFLAVQSVLISFPLGVLLANVLFLNPYRPYRIVKDFLYSSLSKTRHDSYMFPFWILMFLSSILTVTIYILTSDYVPLLGSFVAYGEMGGEMLRSSIYREPDTIHYAHAMMVRFFLPFCLLYSYFMAYVYKGRWKYLFWITLLWAMFASLLTFERVYFFSLFIFLVLAIYFKNNQLISKIHFLSKSKIRLVIFILAIMSLAMLVGGIVSRTQYNLPLDLTSIWNTAERFFISRVLLDPSYMAYIYFEEFNNPSTFLYGKSIRLLSLFGVEFHHTVSPSFVAELWLNFGWFGVLMGTTVIGFILQFIQLRLFRKKSIPTLSFYIILLLNGAWIIYGHVLATMVVSVYLLSVLFLFALQRNRMAGDCRKRGCILQPAGGQRVSGPVSTTGFHDRSA
ncbi:MAG: O-antigen polymerase [Pseudomonadota bacterium]